MTVHEWFIINSCLITQKIWIWDYENTVKPRFYVPGIHVFPISAFKT